MARSSLGAVVVAGALLASSACGSGSGSPAAQFCADLSSHLSRKTTTCARGSPDAIAAAGAYSWDGCASYARAVDAGRASFDAGRAATCLAAVDALGCAGPALFFASMAYAGLPWTGRIPECEDVVTGRVALGGSCTGSLECAEGYCDTSAACPGTCIAYQALGQSCAESRVSIYAVTYGPLLLNTCSPGVACAFPPGTTEGPICATPAAVGGPCPCEAHLYCDTASSTCQIPKTSGPCATALECALGWLCTDGQCQPAGVLGEACQPTMMPGGDFSCAPGYACDPATRTCVVAPGRGESCQVELDGMTYYLACVDGPIVTDGGCTCAPPPPPRLADGQPCTSSAECLGTCDPGQHRCVTITDTCSW